MERRGLIGDMEKKGRGTDIPIWKTGSNSESLGM
jgi:hypothetical protein